MMSRKEPDWPPRGDVAACRADAGLQRQHPFEPARTELGAHARGCSVCGRPATELEWFYFRSPDETWERLCGTSGWIVWCDDDDLQADYLEGTIN